MGITNRDLLIINGFMLLFLLINFNRDLGSIYIAMLLLSWAGFFSDKIKTFTFQKKDHSNLNSIIKAVLFYTGFVLFSGMFLSVFHSGDVIQGQIIMSVLKTFAQTTPALAGSLILTFIGWAIIVPIIETNAFFGMLFEYITDKFNINVKSLSATLLIIMVSLSFLFAIFHATAKGITNNAALSLTFLFALTSLWLVLKEKQTRTAVYLHIIANSFAVLATFSVIG